MAVKKRGLEQFFRAIKPFFYGKSVTYVDAGAYRGDVLRVAIESGLNINEAHLIEPNPQSYQTLEATVREFFTGRSLNVYNMALGARSGTVTLRLARDMTKVVPDSGNEKNSGDSPPNTNLVQVQCQTLDQMAAQFTEGRISLLKLDVEGFELNVLKGAKRLLTDQNIDVIYTEAGMSPTGTQQCYYRDIEDALAQYGYRVFRIFEQMHEWMDDSPILRRANVVFMSPRFAEQHPYRLTRELFSLQENLAKEREARGQVESQLESTEKDFTQIKEELQKQLTQAQDDREKTKKKLDQAQSEYASSRKQLESRLAQAELEGNQLLRKSEDQLTEATARHRKEAQALEARLQNAQRDYTQAVAQLSDARKESEQYKDALRLESERLERRQKALARDFRQVSVYAVALEKKIYALLDSRTWRIMGPVRVLGRAVRRRLLGKQAHPTRLPPQPDALQRGLKQSTLATARGATKRANLTGSTTSEVHSKVASADAFEFVDKAVSLPELEKLDGNPKQQAFREVKGLRLRMRELGFEEQRPLEALEKLESDSSDPYRQRLAARELARWHANLRTPESARTCLALIPASIRGEKNREKLIQAAVLETECLQRIGDTDQARRCLEKAQKTLGPHTDLWLAEANLEEDPASKLAKINTALRHHDLDEIALDQKPGRCLYDCFRAIPENSDRYSADGRSLKVSILMPAFNCEDTLGTAIECLQEQTWHNLEIIIVDDCSTDRTVEVAHEYQSRDSRIQVLKLKANSGAYVARNTALEKATGDFVTVHDSDDWSHPQLIEKQALHLIENSKVMGNISLQARITEDLVIYRRGNYGKYMAINFPSLMFRRLPVTRALGYWDSVRFSGDHEYIRRARRVFGASSIVTLDSGPLSFQRQHDASLTRDQAFGVEGFYFGARKEYFESQVYHHDTARNLYYAFPQTERPFPAPAALITSKSKLLEGDRHYQVVVASDFRVSGTLEQIILQQLEGYLKLGHRIGLVHLPIYQVDPKAGIGPSIRDALYDPMVDMIVYGEHVCCDTLVIVHAATFQEPTRYLPEIDARDIRVIVTSPPGTSHCGTVTPEWTMEDAVSNLQNTFSTQGIWHPIGPAIRARFVEKLKDCPVNVEVSNEDWIPDIKLECQLIETDHAHPLFEKVSEFRALIQGRNIDGAIRFINSLENSKEPLSVGLEEAQISRPFLFYEILNHIYHVQCHGDDKLSAQDLASFARKGQIAVAVVFSCVKLRAGRFSTLNYLFSNLLQQVPDASANALIKGTLALFVAHHISKRRWSKTAIKLLNDQSKSDLLRTPQALAEMARLALVTKDTVPSRNHFTKSLQAAEIPESAHAPWQSAYSSILQLATGTARANATSTMDPPPPYRKLFISGFLYSGSGALYDYLREFGNVSDALPLELRFLESPSGLGECIEKFASGAQPSPAFYSRLFFQHLFGYSGFESWFEAKWAECARLPATGNLDSSRNETSGNTNYAHAVSSLLQSIARAVPEHDNRTGAVITAVNEFLDRICQLYGVDEDQLVILDNYIHPHRVGIVDYLDNAEIYIVTRDPRSQFVSTYFEHQKFHRNVNTYVRNYNKHRKALKEQIDRMTFPDKVHLIQFEELVLSSDFRKSLAARMGLDANKSRELSFFDPKVSSKNVVNYKTFHDQSAIGEIAEALDEYLWEP